MGETTNKKMKIGIYDMYLDAMGGGEKYMLTIASYLSEIHSVDLFWDDKTILKRAEKRFPLNYSNISVVKNLFMSPSSFFEKKKKMESYDLIIYLSDGSIPFLFGKKNILHFQFPTPWVKSQNILTKLKLSKITKVICNSNYTKKYIDDIFHVSSEVLYPPCTLIRHTEKKQNIILTVGRLNILSENNDFKKLEWMLSVFKNHIYPDFNDWKFIVVVTCVEEDKKIVEQWKKDAEKFPIEIMTDIEYSKLAEFYSVAKIYWHAAGYGEDLNKHPERAEHFGIAPVEAMSAGTVPIVINAGGIPEIIDEGKNGMVWTTEKELISKTKQMIIHNDTREKLAENATLKSELFSEESFVKKLLSIIQQIS